MGDFRLCLSYGESNGNLYVVLTISTFIYKGKLISILHKEVLGMRYSKRKYNIAYGIMLLYYDIGKRMGHKANTSTWCVLETEMRISG